MKGIHCLLACGCLLAAASWAAAQSAVPVTNGFVPRHQQLLHSRSLPADADLTSSLERDTRPVTQVSGLEYSDTCGCEGGCNGMRCKLPTLWGGAEYLQWWTNGMDTPVLATSSPLGTLQADAGVLPAATSLFGSDELFDHRGGGRFHLGMSLRPDDSVGIEASFLFLQDETERFRAGQGDFDILARPFFNVALGIEDSRLINFGGLVDGSLSIDARTKFEAFELVVNRRASARTDWLFGYRRARLDDLIRIDETTTSLAAPTLNSTFELFDEFTTENEFHGFEFGLKYAGPTFRGWSLDFIAKTGIGYNESSISIDGQTTTTTAANSVSTVNNGLLAQGTNIGTFKDDDFSTLSEVGLSMTRRYACGISLSVGYRFLHWSDVLRAGNQIDRNINPTQIPPDTLIGDPLPGVPFDRTDFWAQGITGGIEYRY